MGFLLVFFPDQNSTAAATVTTKATDATVVTQNSHLHSPASTKPIKTSNSHDAIITKTKSTLSICSLLLFFTLLLFTLSTFEPANPSLIAPRRLLHEKPRNYKGVSAASFALHGMGRLYRRGTTAMHNIVVAHVVEDTNEDRFRLFLRVLHRSGLASRADIAFIFGSSLLESKFRKVIEEENDSFLKLVRFYKELNRTRGDSVVGCPSFELARFVKGNGMGEKMKETLWGKRKQGLSNDSVGSDELTRLSYGSAVGFEASELDPEDSLAEFLEHVPMSLRRWACYPMLLGRVRRNFKHVVLVEIKTLILMKDPLSRLKNTSSKSVLYMSSKKNNVDSTILMGGIRGIRRITNVMHTEIVRVTTQHKKKRSINESTLLDQLITDSKLLANMNLIKSNESISSPTSLSQLQAHHQIVHIGNNSHDLCSDLMKHLCSCEGGVVYSDC